MQLCKWHTKNSNSILKLCLWITNCTSSAVVFVSILELCRKKNGTGTGVGRGRKKAVTYTWVSRYHSLHFYEICMPLIAYYSDNSLTYSFTRYPLRFQIILQQMISSVPWLTFNSSQDTIKFSFWKDKRKCMLIEWTLGHSPSLLFLFYTMERQTEWDQTI